MPKRFVVYEIWTRTCTTEAATLEEALKEHAPIKPPDKFGFELSNWHAVEVEDFGEVATSWVC